MRPSGLLRHIDARGAAPVETIFAIVLLAVLVLGTVEVGYGLYARNVVGAAAHEAARTAVELGRHPSEGAAIATRTVRIAAGGLVDDLEVSVVTSAVDDRELVRVRVHGRLRLLGPVPALIPVTATASASRSLTRP